IQRNQRYKLAHIEIVGNKFFHTDTLRERIYITPASFPRFRYGRYSQKLLERDKDTLKDLYRASGFRDADIGSTVDSNYRGKAGDLGIVLEVKEGPQWLVGKIELGGFPENDLKYLGSKLQSGA